MDRGAIVENLNALGERPAARGLRGGLLPALALALCFSPLSVRPAAAAPAFPAASGYVNDFAGVLPAPVRDRLEAELTALERDTGAEVAVAVVARTAPETPKMYAVQLFEAWGIGKRGRDNGVLFLVAMEERRVEVEVGYGLEGILPDGKVGALLDRHVVPRFREGDMAGGIAAGVTALAAEVRAGGRGAGGGGGSGAGAGGSPAGRTGPSLLLVLGAVAVGAVLLLAEAAAWSRRRRRCPRCGGRLRVDDEVLREASAALPGESRRVVRCTRCDYHDESLYAIPWVAAGLGAHRGRRRGGWGGPGGRGGWGGGGGGFGGFGGGRSGGGGAGRGW